MRKALALGTAVFFTLLGTAHALRGGQAQDAAPAAVQAGAQAPGDVNVREAYQERLKAARDVVASLDQRIEAGEAQTPTLLDLQALSYRRLAEAEMAAAADDAARVAAAGQYLLRCEHLLKVTDSRFRHGLDTSKFQVDQARYHLADAKVTLAEAMARPAVTPNRR
jgi:hypothetical protein